MVEVFVAWLLDLRGGVQGAAPGALDGYLETILPVMEADLFGDIAEAKEADAFAAKYRWGTASSGIAFAIIAMIHGCYYGSFNALQSFGSLIGHWSVWR